VNTNNKTNTMKNKLALLFLFSIFGILLAFTPIKKNKETTTILTNHSSIYINVNRLIGRWEIYKLTKGNKTKENRKKYIIFHKDGRLSGGRIGKEPNKNGTWSFEKKTNTLLLNSTEDQNDLVKLEIKKLTRKDLVLMKDSTLIYLEKTK
tara:strand:+ start:26 stop:475 length:450 start_codon:yes stop_codon:yes gene_type:complete